MMLTFKLITVFIFLPNFLNVFIYIFLGKPSLTLNRSSNVRRKQDFLEDYENYFLEELATKVLFTDRCRWQNLRPSILCLVDNNGIEI